MPLFGYGLSEEGAVKRVQARLLIGDYLTAVKEAKEALDLFPESYFLKLSHFRALCEKGDEIEAAAFYEKMILEPHQERFFLEALAWGALTKGSHSTQLPVRLNALLGVFFTQDTKAIPILLEEMRSSNAILRSFAVNLASYFGDLPIREELVKLLNQEKVWFVRLEVIAAIGRLKMSGMQNTLKEILTHPKTSLEEKLATMVALVDMYESITQEELAQLIQSNRAELRQLACEISAHLDLKESVSEIYPLLRDRSSTVRIAALNALGFLRVNFSAEFIKEALDDPIPEVAITAAWAYFQFDERAASDRLKEWLRDANPDHRRLAAGAVAVSGLRGVPLALKMIKESGDPYVQVTLGVGLIGQRQGVSLACDKIYSFLAEKNQPFWMWNTQANPLFRHLAPSRLRHIEQIPQYPKVVDQMVRLELLSVLSLGNDPKAEAAVKEFLKSTSWGITGVAAAILLQEGDDHALEAVRHLLNDPDEKIRVPAALICATLGGDPSAATILQEAYPHLDREMRLHILEALAHVGDPHSIPFLVARLKEPFQVLRIAAASALIRCLYH